MVEKRIKNPLRKRWLRELKGNFGRYFAVFLLLVLSIGFVSGFLVADRSMIRYVACANLFFSSAMHISPLLRTYILYIISGNVQMSRSCSFPLYSLALEDEAHLPLLLFKNAGKVVVRLVQRPRCAKAVHHLFHVRADQFCQFPDGLLVEFRLTVSISFRISLEVW